MKKYSTSLIIGGGGGLVARSCLTLATLKSIVRHDPLSMGFSRHQYWSELPFPSPGALPDPRIELGSPELQTASFPSEPQGKP